MDDGMFDPDFDPLEELEQAIQVIEQLVTAHNNHDDLLRAYSQQHQQIVSLLQKTHQRIDTLEHELALLRQCD